ncbi:hypothetical protein BDB00DRAFT_384468 [Zychaea mexicana]|uniref:uncharacterized protein n=1 Tax=Zychaea mexicana TaxID=64656 RepID=UPI0022FEF924|nr:uncharacterized protein BDB00DRAFT_384468 [Zychaea mexicana]KAI9493097.1 hypothetical protein BDB00DRAFT_384468 [Zychaea mexicana]
MAFRFNWPEFDAEFYEEARSQLETALNKGNKPKNIVDHITVKELHMGTSPPELEILEVGELATDKFRGIFKLTYAGDAYIVLQTKVQANPMHAKRSELPRHTRPSILAADRPLVVPMLLRISDLQLRGIVVLVVSKTKGITLVFKNDPLESIVVSSTFDSITSVRNFLQREIEKQLRNLFQEDLPVMIHNLSLRHLQSEQEKQKKQQQEERLKLERLKKLEKRRSASSSMSVFSDPGRLNTPFSRTPTNVPGGDTLSMPELLTRPSFLDSMSHYYSQQSMAPGSPPSAPIFGSFSDLYNAEHLAAFLEAQQQQSEPVTVANLSTLNELYSKRFAAMHDDDELATRMFSDDELEEDDDVVSSVNGSSSVHSAPIADIYSDDVDAPWYVTEGPGLPSSTPSDQPVFMALDQEIVVNPGENALAAKLAQLASNNHTLSPFAYTIDHATYRSLPHTGKKIGPISRNKKIPKRRIIRLQMSNNNTSTSNTTTTSSSTISSQPPFTPPSNAYI